MSSTPLVRDPMAIEPRNEECAPTEAKVKLDPSEEVLEELIEQVSGVAQAEQSNLIQAHLETSTATPSTAATEIQTEYECYDEARILFEAQEQIIPITVALRRRLQTIFKTLRATHPDFISLYEAPYETKIAIERARRFSSNANAMYSALDRFDITAMHKNQKYTPPFREMTSTERTSFIKAYYRATALATLVQQRSLRDLFAPMDMLDVYQMWDILFWMVKLDGPQPMLKSDTDRARAERLSPARMSTMKWNLAYSRMLHVLQKCHNELRVRKIDHSGCVEGLKAQYIVEQEAHRTQEGRGSRMEDVLPFLKNDVFEW